MSCQWKCIDIIFSSTIYNGDIVYCLWKTTISLDIDSDFRTDIKDVLLVYLKKKYGERAIAQILTKSYLQGKSAIDKVVMILGSRDGRDYRYIASKLKNKTGVDFLGKSMEENREA